jgi:hypothetical protein
MMRKIFMLMLVLCAAFAVHTSALAHGHTTVGDYDLVIGFHNEPAISGLPNALDLFVTNQKTGEKVNGLEQTLKAEIIFGSSKKELPIEPQEDQDGAYTAYLIPTQTGDYTWHIFGTINDTPVDVSMTSSPDTFESVEPQADYSFPNSDPVSFSSGSVSAQTALIVGGVGVVLGLMGTIIGLMALQAARRSST